MNDPKTLGDWRKACVLLWGEDSGATAYIDSMIEAQGADEEVVAHSSQVLYLLQYKHRQAKEVKRAD